MQRLNALILHTVAGLGGLTLSAMVAVTTLTPVFKVF